MCKMHLHSLLFVLISCVTCSRNRSSMLQCHESCANNQLLTTENKADVAGFVTDHIVRINSFGLTTRANSNIAGKSIKMMGLEIIYFRCRAKGSWVHLFHWIVMVHVLPNAEVAGLENIIACNITCAEREMKNHGGIKCWRPDRFQRWRVPQLERDRSLLWVDKGATVIARYAVHLCGA